MSSSMTCLFEWVLNAHLQSIQSFRTLTDNITNGNGLWFVLELMIPLPWAHLFVFRILLECLDHYYFMHFLDLSCSPRGSAYIYIWLLKDALLPTPALFFILLFISFVFRTSVTLIAEKFSSLFCWSVSFVTPVLYI